MAGWIDKLREVITREKRDADLERELRAHLEEEEDGQREAGVAPEEALYAARRALGNVPLIQEDTRSAWDAAKLETIVRELFKGLRQDVNYGLRSLRKQPAFTAAAVLALALGIGAATTIASVIQGVLLDPYPMYRDVNRLVNVQLWDLSSPNGGFRTYFQVREFLDYQTQARSFDGVIGGRGEDVLYTTSEGTDRFDGGLTTGNTFSVMGAGALLGRTLTLDDAEPDAPAVFVMSHKVWVGRFGADPDLVGTKFVLNGTPTTLVGIMPPRLSKLGAEVWLPVRLDAADPVNGSAFLQFQARLRHGVTLEAAEAEMNVLARRMAQVYPNLYPQRFSMKVVPIIDGVVGPFRKTLYTMAAAVTLLLLIACANVANMLLSRAAGREKEMAIRAALGAGRTRLVRQLLIESAMLALLGAALGTLFAQGGIKLLVPAIPTGLIPREALIQLDWRVLTFSLGLALLTTLVFGLAPALSTVRRDLVTPLRDSGKGTSGGFRRRRLSSALVVIEVALSLLLLTSAGLLMRSFIKLQTVELGLDPERLLFLRVPLSGERYKTNAAQETFLREVLARLRAMPGVLAATTTTGLPVFGGFAAEFDVPGTTHDDTWRATFQLVSASYFKTLGIPLLQGRDLSAEDDLSSRRVAVVNQRFVQRHLSGASPLGRTIIVKNSFGPRFVLGGEFEIVGVVADAKNQGIQEPSVPEVVVPYGVGSAFSRGIVVRTAGTPLGALEGIKREIWSVDRGLPIANAEPVTTYLARYSYAAPRLGLAIFGTFAALGLVLVVLGVAGVIAYTISRQTHEIGIRMALGAGRGTILRMTLGMGIRWIALGIVAGLLASLAATRAIASQLWNVSPTDPWTLGAVIALVASTGLVASYIAALRATRVDPMVVLKSE
jgi:putative ABC transport system permease protein